MSEIRDRNRNEITKDPKNPDYTRRRNHARMSGRVTLLELINWLAENAPDVDASLITINFADLAWVDDATDHEIAAAIRHEHDFARRREAYRRKTYEELKAEFEPEVTTS